LPAGRSALLIEKEGVNRELVERHLSRVDIAVTAISQPDANVRELLMDKPCHFVLVNSTFVTEDFRKIIKTVRELEGMKTLAVIVLCPLAADEGVWLNEQELYFTLPRPLRVTLLTEQLLSALQCRARNRVSSFVMMKRQGEAQPMRLLLAEDNPTNQMVTSHLLSSMGYSADVVANGLEACEAVGRQKYDVLFMDIQMPEMDGIAATKSTRKDIPKDQQPWIVALTANVIGQARQRYLADGMDDFLGKPLRPQELSAALFRAADACGVKLGSERKGHFQNVEATEGMVVDWNVLRALVVVRGSLNVKLFKTLIEKFLSSVPNSISKLTAAINEGNWKKTQRVAHSAYGSSSTYGVSCLAATLRVLCDESILDDSRARELLTRIGGEYSEAALELRGWENHLLAQED
jgi:CheY-like chemotaxis protein